MRFFGALFLLLSSAALADPNDFQIHQLGDARTDPESHARFRTFARELGAAISSTNLTPPETLGHAAFSVNMELSVLSVRFADLTWPSERPPAADANLLLPSLHIRKGLPFSFEIGARAGWIDRSDMAVGTLEAKWAINEGFLYLPDIAIRVYGTRLFNSRDFDLTTYGADLGVGREFAIGGMITLTPYAGWNLGFVQANSHLVDFNRSRPAEDTYATPVTQLEDAGAYKTVVARENSHNRFYAGIRFIGGVLQLGAELSFVSLGKFQYASAAGEVIDRSLPPVTTYSVTVGLDF